MKVTLATSQALKTSLEVTMALVLLLVWFQKPQPTLMAKALLAKGRDRPVRENTNSPFFKNDLPTIRGE